MAARGASGGSERRGCGCARIRFVATAPRLAIYDDIAHLDEKVHAEIIGGEIVVTPSPTPSHRDVAGSIFAELRAPFRLGRGGPGGWWLIPDVDTWFGPHDIVRPDIGGWRRENVPVFPRDRPIKARPDWICEALSPGTAKYDHGAKRALYARAGVPWYWLVDPLNRAIQVLRLEGPSYVVHQAVGDSGLARLEPFDAVEIELDSLFPPAE